MSAELEELDADADDMMAEANAKQAAELETKLVEQMMAHPAVAQGRGGAPFLPSVGRYVNDKISNIPKDAVIGMWDWLREGAAELAVDAGAAIADVQFQQYAPMAGAMGSKAAEQGVQQYMEQKAKDATPEARAMRDLQARQGIDLPPNLDDVTSMDLRDIDPELVDSLDRLRAEYGKGDDAVDVFVQKVFQFSVPFLTFMGVSGGLSKVPGVAGWLRSAGKIGLAEALTAYSAFDSHEARFADLLREYGPEDNRLLNAYIDYAMSDPADTDAEGRWKNVVDNALFSLPFYGADAAFRLGKVAVMGIREHGRLGPMMIPGSPASQRGSTGSLLKKREPEAGPNARGTGVAMEQHKGPIIRIKKENRTASGKGGFWLGERAPAYADELERSFENLPISSDWAVSISTDVSNKSGSEYVTVLLDNGEINQQWKIRISDHELPEQYQWHDRGDVVFEVRSGDKFTPTVLSEKIRNEIVDFASREEMRLRKGTAAREAHGLEERAAEALSQDKGQQ